MVFHHHSQKPYEFLWSFEHDDRTPYEFIWFLTMMMKNHMNSYPFLSIMIETVHPRRTPPLAVAPGTTRRWAAAPPGPAPLRWASGPHWTSSPQHPKNHYFAFSKKSSFPQKKDEETLRGILWRPFVR